MRRYRVAFLMAAALLVALATAGNASTNARSPSYRLHQWTHAASAGGTSAGANLRLRGTLGQGSVSLSQGPSHAASGGIWRGFAAANVLVMEKEFNDDAPPVETGDELVFVVAVTNNGYRVQEQVIVTDTVPPGLSLLGSPQADAGTVGVDGDTITLSVPELTYEQIAVLTYRVLVEDGTEGQTITNTAVARSADYGPISQSAVVHVFEPGVVYLPLVARRYSPAPVEHTLEDAPDTCPGHATTVGDLYRDDWDFPNDNDWYSFEAVGGQTYTIQTSDLESRADTIVTLRAPDCATQLAENDDISYPGNVASRIVWTAPASGTYHVMVRAYDWRVYGNDTGYTFSVSLGGLAGSAADGASKPPPLPTPTPASSRPPGDALVAVRWAGQKPTPPPTPTPEPKPPAPPTPTPTPEPKPPAPPTPTPPPLLPLAGGSNPAGPLLLAGLILVVAGCVVRRGLRHQEEGQHVTRFHRHAPVASLSSLRSLTILTLAVALAVAAALVVHAQKPTPEPTPAPQSFREKPPPPDTPTPEASPTTSRPPPAPTPTPEPPTPTATNTPRPRPTDTPVPTPTDTPTPTPTPGPTPVRVITGRVFDDRDGDGAQDPDEPGVAGVPVVLDGRVVAASDAGGRFSLPLPGPGRALLSIVPPEGWEWPGEPLTAGELLAMGEVAIPLRRLDLPEAALDVTATTVTGGVAVVALLVGLAFNGFASLIQAAAVRSLQQTYRRQKSQELELAMAHEIAARQEQLRQRLATEPEAWREIVRQLLADARAAIDTTLIDVSDISATPYPSFVITGNGWDYVFTTAPGRPRGMRALRRRERVVSLDAALSLFARIEAQALWDHLAQGLRGGQTTLPRDVAWYLVMRKSSDWRPRVRKKKRHRIWWLRRRSWV